MGLAPSAKLDAAHTFFSLVTPAVRSECPALWQVCSAWADASTASSNPTEPDVTYTFGANRGSVRYETPYPAVTQSDPSDLATTEWCRSLDLALAGQAATLYLGVQSNFLPPRDGSLDVRIKASLQYTPMAPTAD